MAPRSKPTPSDSPKPLRRSNRLKNKQKNSIQNISTSNLSTSQIIEQLKSQNQTLNREYEDLMANFRRERDNDFQNYIALSRKNANLDRQIKIYDIHTNRRRTITLNMRKVILQLRNRLDDNLNFFEARTMQRMMEEDENDVLEE